MACQSKFRLHSPRSCILFLRADSKIFVFRLFLLGTGVTSREQRLHDWPVCQVGLRLPCPRAAARPQRSRQGQTCGLSSHQHEDPPPLRRDPLAGLLKERNAFA